MRIALQWRIIAAVMAAVCSVTVIAQPHQAQAANPVPPFISAGADWLTSLNYFRAMAALPPVTEDLSLSPGAYNHSCYMLLNDITHDELPGAPGYTASGDLAGNSSNVAVNSATGVSNRSFVELWMTGPFHAIGILRANLQRVGFGQCENPGTPRWHSGATLDVLHGLGPQQGLGTPTLFPGDGTVTNLTQFVAESPNPVQLCGWGNTGAGLPVIAMMPENFSSNPSASMTGPSGPVQTCVLSRHNTTGTAQSILGGDNAVVVMPRSALAPGLYTVSVTTSARSVTWSFTVDPAAGDFASAPPAGSPTSGATGWQPITPARFVDSRINSGATKLLAGVPKRIKLSGRLGLPLDATAISANFTVAGTAGPGYLTVWNCSNPMPVVSTLNFEANDAVSNSASTPLDSSGNVCVYSPVGADILIDVSGYYSAAATSKFTPVVPDRVMDTRGGIGSGRLGAGQVVELPLPAAPAGATGAMLNVTTILPDVTGFVTVYPCGQTPPTSSVNSAAGGVRPNTVTTALSANRSVCLYSNTAVDVIVDVFGYMAPSDAAGFTPSSPFRWTDTRDKWVTAMNFGTGGQRLGDGQTITLQVAGQRGVPSTARAVSFNVTVADGIGNAGYVTAFPCGTRPNTSNLNFGPGQAVANGAMVSLSASGTLCIYVYESAHVIVDVNGWWG
ncbi:MAG TPA: CAP domain-containing protein [Ilumatobacteraceae bacterium]|nr:CAP domain-containing protein [Ilumatobacteraceae bacterium]